VERPGVWDKVQSDHANCMGRRCAHYNACFYQNARREMENANILVCNHALFFSDHGAADAGGTGFLPEYQHVVLDEAHGVEDVAAITSGRR
jgi:ATP-dependent DNA helicase DinG